MPGACDLLLDRRMVPVELEPDVKREIDQLLALAHDSKERSGELGRMPRA